jgi:hypothetical protein
MIGTEDSIWAAFKERRAKSQEKRADNRKNSRAILDNKNCDYQLMNDGAHLIVKTNSGLVDFWPGTGRWIIRNTGRRGFGVQNLINLGLVTKSV